MGLLDKLIGMATFGGATSTDSQLYQELIVPDQGMVSKEKLFPH